MNNDSDVERQIYQDPRRQAVRKVLELAEREFTSGGTATLLDLYPEFAAAFGLPELLKQAERDRDDANERARHAEGDSDRWERAHDRAAAQRDEAEAAFAELVALAKEAVDWSGRNEQGIYAKFAFALAAAPTAFAYRARARLLREAADLIRWTGETAHPENMWMEGRYQQTLAIELRLRMLANEAERAAMGASDAG